MKKEIFESSTSKIKLSMSQASLLYRMRDINNINKKLYNIGDMRGIGITTALIEFCKMNGYTLIVPNLHMESMLKEKYNCNLIISQSNIRQLLDGERCIVDTGVDLNSVRLSCNVIGGIIDLNGYKKYGDDLNVNIKNNKSGIIDVLDNEIQQLISKIKKAREDENWGTYKNLILSLGEVMRLKQKERENDWHLMYSENESNNGKQIVVWEENGDMIIRAKKIWNVKDDQEENKCIQIKVPTCNMDKEMIDEYISKLQKTLSNNVYCIGR